MTRRLVTTGLVLGLAVLAAVGYYALRPGGHGDGNVAVDAAIQLSADSNEPAGGRVDYGLVVYNAGGTPVRVRDVTVRGNGLTIRDQDNSRPQLISVGGSSLIRLSVQLDCHEHAVTSDANAIADSVRSRLTVLSAGGAVHRLTLSVEASSLTQVADTFCSVAPDRRTELSGPILLRTTVHGEG